MSDKPEKIALYHVVRPREKFNFSAQSIMKCLQIAQKNKPDVPRVLYLDIEGHRNKAGGFDHDMYELQTHFMLKFVAGFVSEIHMPLGEGYISNPKPQNNDIPERLDIFENREQAERCNYHESVDFALVDLNDHHEK